MQKPNSDSIMKTEGWGQINWRKAERYVFRLQKRIYKASFRGKFPPKNAALLPAVVMSSDAANSKRP